MDNRIKTTSKIHQELEDQIQLADKELDRLRALYEQYFQGIERLEPTDKRKTVGRMIRSLFTSPINNTALRFRISQLMAKLNTYENYWGRVSRQIEEGTYHRNLYMARYRSGKQEPDQNPEQNETTQENPLPAAARRQPAANGYKLSDSKIDAIYNAYLTAKKRCRESTNGLTRDALANSLRNQIPNILRKQNCKSVEFKVVIRNNRAILKVVPKF
jgi:hypothetical protein